MNIVCPACGVSGRLDDAWAGRRVRCPKCNTLFQARQPEDPGEEPEVPQSAATAEGSEARASQEEATSPPEPPPPGEEESTVAPPAPATIKKDRQQSAEDEDATAARPDHGASSQDQTALLAGPLLRQAWELTRGVKAPVWVGLIITHLASVVCVSIAAAFYSLGNGEGGSLLVFLLNTADWALSMILTAGLMYMGVRRATGRQVNWRDVLSGFGQAGQLLVAALLQTVLITVGLLLLIAPGIYLMIGYMMTFPLILDEGMSPWQAMECSRRALHPVWWRVFGVYLLMLLIVGISAIPFGLGLIWTIPMLVVINGVIYARLLPGIGKR